MFYNCIFLYHKTSDEALNQKLGMKDEINRLPLIGSVGSKRHRKRAREKWYPFTDHVMDTIIYHVP